MKKLIKYFKKKEFNKSKEVAEAISEYYCEKDNRNPFNREDITQAGKDIDMLGITDLKFKGNRVTIKLKRAGILIGRRGENINKLNKFLSKELGKDIKIYIVEDMLMGWLEPMYFDEDDF